MKKWLILVSFFFVSTALASEEVVQIVTFDWDETLQKLSPIAIGSGTVVQSNLVLTNEHVVRKDKELADFVLLCRADHKSNKPATCDIPAGVIASHPNLDAALIRPLKGNLFPNTIATSKTLNRPGDQIRVYGFPIPVDKLQNFGGNRTLSNIRKWAKEGGVLQPIGDKLTITRGEITNIGREKSSGDVYYLTNVKVNFGNSGGAAFDEYHNFLGIPTYRDKAYNALILEYNQLKDWIAESAVAPLRVDDEIVVYYEKQLLRPTLKNTRTVPRTNRARYKNFRRIRTLRDIQEMPPVQPVKTSTLRRASRDYSRLRWQSTTEQLKRFTRKTVEDQLESEDTTE